MVKVGQIVNSGQILVEVGEDWSNGQTKEV